jgi:hypothetical protein
MIPQILNFMFQIHKGMDKLVPSSSDKVKNTVKYSMLAILLTFWTGHFVTVYIQRV